MPRADDNSTRRCAMCRGKGRRSDGDMCRGCDGMGNIPAKKVKSATPYPTDARVMIQWKRASGLIH